MSTVGSESVGGAPTAAQVEALIRECDALRDALGRANTVRRILIVGLLLFVAATGAMFYDMARRIGSRENLDDVTRRVQERLAGRSDSYMKEVQLLVDRSTPVITDAFYKQAKKDMPLYLSGVEEQRTVFVENLRARAEKALAEHYDKVIAKHEETLRKEFPKAEDPEVRKRLVANLHAVFERLIRKYYIDDLNGQMVALYDNWDHFPAADVPGRDDPRLEDQFIGTLLEIVKQKVTEDAALATATTGPAVVPATK